MRDEYTEHICMDMVETLLCKIDIDTCWGSDCWFKLNTFKSSNKSKKKESNKEIKMF